MLSSYLMRLRPYLNWSVAVLGFLVHLTIQVSSGMLAEPLSQAFGLDSVGVAFLMGMVFYPNILLQIPAGMVTDRFGAKRVLFVGGLVCAIGAYWFSIAEGFLEACISRFVMGSGLSFAFVSMAYLIANWMRREVFSLMFSLAEMIALSFTVFAMRYLALALKVSSWRIFIQNIGYFALGVSVLSLLVVKDRPDYMEDSQPSLAFKDLVVQLRQFMRDYKMWANGIYSGLLFSCLTCFVGQWGPGYLANATEMSLNEAAKMCTNLTLGLVVACPLLSLALPRIKHIRMALSLAALITSIMLSLVVFFPLMDLVMMRTCLFITGFFSVAYLSAFTIANYYVKPGSKSTAIGFTNMLSTIFGPMLSIIIGLLIDHHTDRDLLSGYSLADYQYGMNVLPVCMFLAALICFFVPYSHKPGLADDI